MAIGLLGLYTGILGRDAEINRAGAITIRQYPIGRWFVEQHGRSNCNEFLA